MHFWLKRDAGVGHAMQGEGLFKGSGLDSMTKIEKLDWVQTKES